MSFLSNEDFEELSLDGEVAAVTCSQYVPSKAFTFKEKKKLKIPILNKATANPNTFEYENLLKQLNLNSKFRVDSNFVKTPSPRSDTRKTIERLLFNHQLSQNRKQFLRTEKELQEIKGCTFSPTIHSADRILKKSNSDKQKNLKILGNDEEAKKTNTKVEESKKGLKASLNKSHSQEHHLGETYFHSPKKDKLTGEGRPPIPKNKIIK